MMLDEFAKTPYTFQQLTNGLVAIEYTAQGVFKERVGITNDGRHDSHSVTSTLHIYSYEPFLAVVGGYMGLQWHIVSINGQSYRIDGATNGTDLTGSGVSEFYRLTLTKQDSVWQSDLPQS